MTHFIQLACLPDFFKKKIHAFASSYPLFLKISKCQVHVYSIEQRLKNKKYCIFTRNHFNYKKLCLCSIISMFKTSHQYIQCGKELPMTLIKSKSIQWNCIDMPFHNCKFINNVCTRGQTVQAKRDHGNVNLMDVGSRAPSQHRGALGESPLALGFDPVFLKSPQFCSWKRMRVFLSFSVAGRNTGLGQFDGT